ncbi:MAG: tetratricopeptide repeat protein [Planctomycetota bacterium]
MVSRACLLLLLLPGCTSTAGEDPAEQAPSPAAAEAAPRVDLERERRLLGEARASLERMDYVAARAGAKAAVDALLERPATEGDEAWIELLVEAAGVAKTAQDPRVAIRAYDRVLEVRERTLDADDLGVQSARLDVAVTTEKLGDPAKARALEEQILEVLSRTLPDDHPMLQRVRQSLGVALKALGHLEEAASLYEKVYEVRSRKLPDDHKDLQATRMNLAAAVKELGDLGRARELEEKVLEIRTRTLPEDHPDLQRVRSNLGATLFATGDVPGCRALQEQVLAAFSRTLPPEHPDLQTARLNLSVSMYFLRDLQGARTLQERVLEDRSRILADDHMDMQVARFNLASTLSELGDLSGARALEEKVMEVLSRTLPDDHPHLQAARTSLALTYSDLGDHERARALQEKVLEVLSARFPPEHLDLLKAKARLASTLWDFGDQDAARTLQEEVLETRTRVLGEEHAGVYEARAALASILNKLGDYAAALELQERVLEFRSRTLSAGDSMIQSSRRNLAVTHLYDSASRQTSAGAAERDLARDRITSLLQAQCRDEADTAIELLRTAPAREAEERCAELAKGLNVTLSAGLGFGVFDSLPELWPDAFQFSEVTRNGGVLAAAVARRAADSLRNVEMRKRLHSATEELASLARRGTTSEEYQRARVARESIERELLELGQKTGSAAAVEVRFDPALLQARLGPGAAAVAFRRFFQFTLPAQPPEAETPTPLRETSVESLCAFVTVGGEPTAPVLLELGPVAPIRAAVEAWREALGVASGRGVSAERREEAGDLHARGSALRRLVFDPLRGAIGDAERLIVVLDEALNLVPLDVLPAEDEGDRLLGDLLAIENRATLFELLEAPVEVRSSHELVALGGASFGADPEEGDAIAGILRGGAWDDGFTPLPGTLGEIEGLRPLLADAAGPAAACTILSGDGATRQALVEAAPRARWLHLATHGWYASESIRAWGDPEPTDRKLGLLRSSGEEQIRGMSPMVLCGLALAGANLPEDAVGRARGLLTAEELSTLDLSGCELAVLSACDTNLGVVRAGQGVASLQKALQMAGARSVITSLWKVPDEATKELMLDFYRRIWILKQPKARALWEAKMALRHAKDERGQPRYALRDWAAWVLTGEPE